MKATSTAQRSSVLNEGYSLCQIQDRTGLGKYTVGRISKEVLGDKENCPRGCPSKLSSHDQHSIIRHGGGNNLMVWGCMGWNGVEKLIEVEGKI